MHAGLLDQHVQLAVERQRRAEEHGVEAEAEGVGGLVGLFLGQARRQRPAAPFGRRLDAAEFPLHVAGLHVDRDEPAGADHVGEVAALAELRAGVDAEVRVGEHRRRR